MRTQNLEFIGLALLLTAASSCAVSMKMQGNRFESSEVYGKTAGRIDTAYDGQANIELTPDYTFTAPSTTNPNLGAIHDLAVGGGMGIKDRFEIGINTNWVAHAKYQIFGAPKIRAEEGNVSLSAVASLGYDSDTRSDSGLSSNYYNSHIEYTTVGAQLVAGYRLDPLVNFYFGPFAERGNYTGTYAIQGVSTTNYSGQATNVGGLFGLEIGSPRVSGMIEGAWNHTTSGSSKNSYWLGGAKIIISFGSVKPSEPKTSERE